MVPDPPADLRASDADREAVVARLQTAAHEGRIDADELEERIAAAYAARYTRELTRLVLDVTPPPAPVPVTPTSPRVTERTNAMAIASLTSGVFWFAWVGSLLAIVFGHIALSQIKRSEVAEGGRGLAIAGLVLGYGALAFLVFVFVMAFGL